VSAFDLVIAGGEVLDGYGAAAVRADVGIRDGCIAAVGDLALADASRRIDATGRVVAPGFIDIHGHSDVSLLVDPGAGSALAQGVTTEIVGNCGHGCAPWPDRSDARFAANVYGWAPGLVVPDWGSMAGYLDRLAEARPAINVGTLVPFGNLRLVALADVARPATGPERAAMLQELEAALDAGAFGFSTGLEYPAEHAAPLDEVTPLVRAVARRDRLYATHTRDRGRHVVESTGEAIEAARAGGARTQVSHILARRGSAPADADARITEALEAAAAEGLPVAWDVHTRLFGITNLSTALEGRDAARGRLQVGPEDAGVIASFGRAGWDRTFILDAGPGFEELAVRSVAQVAADRGLAPEELLRAVLRAAAAAGDLDRPMAIGMTYDEASILGALRSARCVPASDGTTMDLGSVLLPRLLPGAFTWAAWFVRRAVRETGTLDLAEAVRRLTSLPAGQAGLVDRGRLVPGARADLVVFDAAAVEEPADPIRPASLARGIDLVLVNGRVALTDGRPTGERAGEVLRA
jgi:N-acyl-D-amino-acid deacylase